MINADFPITNLSVDQYVEMRNLGWVNNAAVWPLYVAGDQFRSTFYKVILDEVSRLKLKDGAQVADFGCGDGRLNRLLKERFRALRYVGIDNSKELLEEAADQCQTTLLMDLESSTVHLDEALDVAIAAMSLIEMTRLDVCVANIGRNLKKGGVAIIVTLDPTRELFRWLRFKRHQPGARIFEVEGELVIASHFILGDSPSPSPYFQFLRPLDVYISSARKMDLFVRKIISFGAASVISEVNEPRGTVLILEKSG